MVKIISRKGFWRKFFLRFIVGLYDLFSFQSDASVHKVERAISRSGILVGAPKMYVKRRESNEYPLLLAEIQQDQYIVYMNLIDEVLTREMTWKT